MLTIELLPGDLLVLNDAATLPAMLSGDVRGKAIEARLLAPPKNGEADVLLFGEGNAHMRTEDRRPPPALARGDVLNFKKILSASVQSTSHAGRVAHVAFDKKGAELWTSLYRAGKPVQYAHIDGNLEIWDVSSAFASRPWAVEMPSAGRPLGVGTLLKLKQRGVDIGVLTHAAGLSSTGDAALDRELPLAERYEIRPELVRQVRETKARGGRVIAVGTTVVRALEGDAQKNGELIAETAETTLRIGPHYQPKIVDGILTGIHEPKTSHFDLVSAFAPESLLERAVQFATENDWLGHELGDSMLVLASPRAF